MSNPLTGDFEAVLSVSGVTINRLLASMHQNDGANANTPTLPHLAAIRIGDNRPIDGLRGWVLSQISTPRIELIHGSTDRFWLEVGVRARYKPDAGTQALPEFIHGTVRAQYRLEGIDPSCVGWKNKAAEYIWVRVVGDSVSFNGTAVDDFNPMMIPKPGESPAVVNARITHLISVLLKTRFEATPHRVSKRFRRGMMRSLHLGIDQSAVVVPIGVSGDPVPGKIDSIDQDLLEGRDFGIAISREYILSKVQPLLDDVKANYNQVISIRSVTNVDVGLFDADVLTVEISWRVTLTSATASWSGGWIPLMGISAGIVTITIAGQALTQNSAFNMSFTATQIVVVTFDSSSERFVVTASGSPQVQVQPQGFEKYAKSRIEGQVKPQVEASIGQIVNELDLSTRKIELIKQLQTLDEFADAHFDEGIFGPDGVIVRGGISLSPRKRPVSTFDRAVEGDGFTALESWIPGGTIDRFEWSWKPFESGAKGGSIVHDDRFLLRRPPATGMGKFGLALGLKTSLPGLDGGGRVCLKIGGSVTDPNTGALLPVQSMIKCQRFGFDIHAIGSLGTGRLFIREFLPKPQVGGDPGGPVEEIGLVEVGRANGRQASNTLVLYAGERWNPETANILRDALRNCRRDDAGLLVLVLFRDGALTAGGSALRAEIDRLSESLEAQIVANEDVHGSWSTALDLRSEGGGRSWRLIGPGGGVTWMHDGHITADALAAAMDGFLLPSPPPNPRPVEPHVDIGTRLAVSALHPGYADLLAEAERRCPPIPVGRMGALGSVITFVNVKAPSSRAQLKQISDRYAGRGSESPTIVAVVDGASPDEVEALGRELGIDITTLPDPEGTIATRFGVRVWPTTVTVNRAGTVSEVEIGHAPEGRPEGSERPGNPNRSDDRDRERGGQSPTQGGGKS